MILLAKRLENDDNVYFGALDATARRNAYGRQLGSFASTAEFGDIKDFPLVFIRGPFVSDVGADATIETEVDGRVVGLRQGNILATAFHPGPHRRGTSHSRSYFSACRLPLADRAACRRGTAVRPAGWSCMACP